MDRRNVMEEALKVGEMYEFNLLEQFALFGFVPRAATPKGLQDLVKLFLIELGSIDVWNRCHFLIAIRGELEKRFPGDIAAQVRWIDETKLRDAITGVHQMELFQIARRLGSGVEFEGENEMCAVA